MKISHVLPAAFLAACLPFYSGANATDVDPLKDIEPSVVAEMADLYAAFCLNAFPDDAAIDQLASSKGAQPLTADQVRIYLRNDPGRGWYLQTTNTLYAITIEHPPVRACAIRRMTPAGFNTLQPYLAVEQNYAMSKGARMGQIPPQNSKTPGGADVTAFPRMLLSADNKPTEGLFIFLTTYHGRVPAEFAAEAHGATGVEIRFVHQLITPPSQ